MFPCNNRWMNFATAMSLAITVAATVVTVAAAAVPAAFFFFQLRARVKALETRMADIEAKIRAAGAPPAVPRREVRAGDPGVVTIVGRIGH